MARNKHPEITEERIIKAATKLFMEKGYENTTIQDIVDELGDLSKGAIYHHFKSKDEIVEAVGDQIHRGVNFSTMFDDCEGMTGREKLKQLVLFSVKSSEQQQIMKSMPTIMNNPKFLALAVRQSVEDYAPIIVPYIEEGNKDGSLKVMYVKEAAEILMLLANVWVNPIVFKGDMEPYIRKILVLKEVLDGMGLTIMDEEVVDAVKDMKVKIQ